VGWERELRGRAKDAEDGRHESKKKMYSVEYAKGACGPKEQTKGLGRIPRGNSKENRFLNFNDF
jgi:hypothetical protein